MTWPVEVDDWEFHPIPQSWIEHGVDADAGQKPRVYAVSAATEYGGRMLQIRYAHPTEPYVIRYSHEGYEGENGIVPAALSDRQSEWPRSLVPATEPSDAIRDCEWDHLQTLWGDRVGRIPTPDDADDQRLIADGGQVAEVDRTEFPRLKADIGEDPARWLAPQTDMDPTPRIRGISEPEVAAAWLAVARRLGVDGDVRDKIKRRRDYLADREADQRGVDK
ncbi:hypothetical protein [Halomicrobium urmianum]|uniref:hypothetical protein n=2 Tax=Halomicrobium urmianum TaxID=1586233 RepID=UPI001CD9F8AF|nr:hypothetical protein [Halomicrobium urmianum]